MMSLSLRFFSTLTRLTCLVLVATALLPACQRATARLAPVTARPVARAIADDPAALGQATQKLLILAHVGTGALSLKK